MATDIIFYTNPWSRGRIAHWLLEELGEPYTTEWLEYGSTAAGGMKHKGYLAINPMGKVPAIQHRGRVVTEVDAICAYLAAAYPAKKLMPAVDDIDSLTQFYRWLVFAAGPLEMAVTARLMKWPATAEHARMLGFGTYEATMDAIAGYLGGREFVCDSGFSAADVALGSSLIFSMDVKAVEPRAVFEDYAARLMKREAYGRHVKLCEARIKEVAADEPAKSR